MPRPGRTLERPISPPPLRRKSTAFATLYKETRRDDDGQVEPPPSAAIEAGLVEIQDHLNYFVKCLSAVRRSPFEPQISIQDFANLYQRNQQSHGRHFVVHQHDHPISGVHYDLRLQFSETSSISFALPYGLPGNPDSLRPNRMAIETRVHNVWNHLIESASHATGSLLIWDTGEYEVLPRKQPRPQQVTDDDMSDVKPTTDLPNEPESTKLFRAFRSRSIRLRLHGAKLPRGYTITLRLPSANNQASQPKKSKLKRRRIDSAAEKPKKSPADTSDESDEACSETADPEADKDLAAAVASEDEEDATIRVNNAYSGAVNTIGSIHQRRWLLTLDKQSSGFRKSRDVGRWIGDWEPFYVRGRDHERSVVTGRCADEVMADEGVEDFVGRKMWRAIVE